MTCHYQNQYILIATFKIKNAFVFVETDTQVVVSISNKLRKNKYIYLYYNRI